MEASPSMSGNDERKCYTCGTPCHIFSKIKNYKVIFNYDRFERPSKLTGIMFDPFASPSRYSCEPVPLTGDLHTSEIVYTQNRQCEYVDALDSLLEPDWSTRFYLTGKQDQWGLPKIGIRNNYLARLF